MTTSIHWLLRCGLLVVLSVSTLGCSLFEQRHPRFATKDFYDVEWHTWGHNLEGEKWKRKVYEVVHNASKIETERDLGELGGHYRDLTQTVVYTLADLERRDARFRVRVTASGRARIELLRGPSVTNEDGMLGFLDGLVVTHNTGNAIKRVQLAMSTAAELEDMLRNRALGTVSDRVYYLTTELKDLRDTGVAPKVTLPTGMTWKEYEELLFVLMARLESDHRELQGFVGTLAATRVALRAMDSEVGGSVANIAAIVAASDRDRRAAAEMRERLSRLPPEGEAREKAAKLGKRRFEALVESGGYLAFVGEGGTARGLKRFGGEIVSAAKLFSIGLSRDSGVDILGEVEDAAAQGQTFSMLLAVAIEQAPVDSHLRKLLLRGQGAAEAVAAGEPVETMLLREGANAGFALVRDRAEAQQAFRQLERLAR